MQLDNFLILVRQLRNHLSLIRPEDHESAEELREARSICETLIQSLEALIEEGKQVH